jgi:uncharacterized protein DUF6228
LASDEDAREVRFGFDGASLALSDVHDGSSTRSAHGELWAVNAVLALAGVHAEARVWLSDLDAPLNAFFHDLADNWRGWKGTKEWATYEGGLRLSCTSDRLGHIAVSVDLHERSGPDGWFVQGDVPLEAGQLEQLAADVARFIEPR